MFIVTLFCFVYLITDLVAKLAWLLRFIAERASWRCANMKFTNRLNRINVNFLLF